MSDSYAAVTARLLSQLDAGTAPWRKPWQVHDSSTRPRSVGSGEPYRGGNAVVLRSAGYSSPWWLTYREAQRRGGHVRSGERSHAIIHWRWYQLTDQRESVDRPQWRASARTWHVFSLDQCDGVDMHDRSLPALPPEPERIARADTLIETMPERPHISHGGERACYRPWADDVLMPPIHKFGVIAEYYSTLLHELVHSTGAPHRIGRPGVTEVHAWGDEIYSEEELIAELGALYLCDELELAPAVLPNSAAYCVHWSRKLRQDGRLWLRVSAAAGRAAAYIARRVYDQHAEPAPQG